MRIWIKTDSAGVLLEENLDTVPLFGSCIVEVELGLAQRQQEDILRARRSAIDDLINSGVDVLVPMRLPAIGVLNVIVPREVPAGEHLARVAVYAGIRRECGDRASDEQRCFGMGEVGVLFDGVAPILLGDSEVIEHGLRAQKAWRDGYGGYGMVGEFHRHCVRESNDGHLAEIVEELSTIAVEGSVRELDNEPTAAVEHEWDAVTACDDVRMDRVLHHCEALLDIDIPEGLAPFGEGVAAPDIVNEDVELAVVGAHPFKQLGDRGLLGVINAHGDARAAGGGDLLGGLFDRLRSYGISRSIAATATRAVHGGARLPECSGDAAARSTRGTGNERNPTLQHHGGRISHCEYCRNETRTRVSRLQSPI